MFRTNPGIIYPPIRRKEVATMTIARSKTNPMRRLYERLGSVGVSRPYLKDIVLPSWWDDEIALSPAGYAEALSFMARNLGLELQSLQNPEGPLLRHDLGPRRFKHQAHVSEEQLQVAECIALRAAQLSGLATSAPVQDLPASAAFLRAHLLEQGLPYITFEALLDLCWDRGIPVLHIAHYPKGVRKMDGIAARIGGRPAIVLSCKRKHSAWLEFHLAHELGHVAQGHLKDDGVLVEDEDAEDADEEKEANEYAIELLTGKPQFEYGGSVPLSPRVLADKARAQGPLRKINPGVLALNYAYTTSDWQHATSALKIIEPSPNAIAVVHAKMQERLDWERLPEESQEFLMRVTGAKASRRFTSSSRPATRLAKIENCGTSTVRTASPAL
jgi:hypothetical protein